MNPSKPPKNNGKGAPKKGTPESTVSKKKKPGRATKKRSPTWEDRLRVTLITALCIGVAVIGTTVILIGRALSNVPVEQDVPGGSGVSVPPPASPEGAPSEGSDPLSSLEPQGPLSPEGSYGPAEKPGTPGGAASPEKPGYVEGENSVTGIQRRGAPIEASPSSRASRIPENSVERIPSSSAVSRPAGGVIERPPTPQPKTKGTIAIILDDAGNNLHEVTPFLRLPFPLTIAVLPGLPYSAEVARRIRAAGKEVILHQPMEAVGGQNPGPGAIYSTMSEEEIRRVLEKNLTEVGPVVGINNHQGSRITSDPRIMKIVLAFCKEHGLYYIDSRTTADTVVPLVAKEIRLPIGERDVFIDNVQEKETMIRFIRDGVQKAEKKGAAVMIGHVWSSELAATLEELYPELIAQGFTLSTVSRIVMGNFEDEGFGD
ncbi:MAG: divergent polysaccharide deacetylase family protein [Breznakiellaceae bacterium]